MSPVYRTEWITTDALVAFVSNYIFVIASSFLGMVSGHVTWSAQEQLYQARRVGRVEHLGVFRVRAHARLTRAARSRSRTAASSSPYPSHVRSP